MKQKYILEALNICVLSVSLIFLITCIINIDLLNATQLVFLILGSLLAIIFSVSSYLSRKMLRYNIGVIFTIIINIIAIYNIYEINNDYSYIENLVSPKYSYKDYYVYVKKNTKYNSLEKIKNKKIGVLEKNKNNVLSYIRTKTDVDYVEYSNREELIESFNNNEIQAIVISKQTLNELEKEEKTSNYHKIYSSKIKESI